MILNRHGMPLPEHFDEQKWLFLFEKGLISAEHYDAGLRFVGRRPLPQQWQGFISRLLLFFGLFCFASALLWGVWSWWPQWPMLWRWELSAGLPLVLALLWLLWPPSPWRQWLALLWLAAIAWLLYWLKLQGVTIALLLPLGLSLVFVVAAYQQSSALWLLFLLVVNAALGWCCWLWQAEGVFSSNFVYMLFFSLNLLFFILAEIGWRRDVAGLPRWLLGWIYLFVLAPLLIAAVTTLWQMEAERWYLHDGIPFIPLYLIFVTSSLWFYRQIRHDSWILTLILLSLLIFVPMLLYAVFSGIHELTWVILVSIQAIVSVLWLQYTRRSWEKRLLRLSSPAGKSAAKPSVPVPLSGGHT
jgi:hypothetical protein